MSAHLLVVQGRVQTDGRVIHVVADHLEDRSDRLESLSQDDMPGITTRGDHPINPLPGQVGVRAHPRNVRVIEAVAVLRLSSVALALPAFRNRAVLTLDR